MWVIIGIACQYSLTANAQGTTVPRHLAAGAERAQVERELTAWRRFQALVPEWVEGNEGICEARPLAGESMARTRLKKQLPRSSRRR